MGYFTCAQICVRAVHTKGGQTQTSLHKSWLGGIHKLSVTLPRQGIEPRGFGFKFWRSNHLAATFPVKPLVSSIVVVVRSLIVDQGDGVAQLVERQTRDPKTGGSNPVRSMHVYTHPYE